LFLPFVLVIIQRSVIGREEAYLVRRFGDDYQRYLSQVRRWL
jgi:protein-S-isoprenylcysteine O-methyltransferase Ste14